MDIVPKSTNQQTDDVETIGEREIVSNRFFGFVDRIMSDPELRTYFDEFFGSWNDIRAVIMVMKTYQMVDEQLKENNVSFSSPEQKRKVMIGIMKEMLVNPSCRSEMVSNMVQFEKAEYPHCKKHLKRKKIDLIGLDTNINSDV